MKITNQIEAIPNEGIIKIKIAFDESDLILNHSPFGTSINLDGCVLSGKHGGPALPSKVIRVALPANSSVFEVVGRNLKEIFVKIPKLVKPMTPPLCQVLIVLLINIMPK
jgi:hypothetical protein